MHKEKKKIYFEFVFGYRDKIKVIHHKKEDN